MAPDVPSTVKSADRVLDIFELLARSRREMAHTEIVEGLDIPKSSLTPLLRNLVARGYLHVSANGRNYRLGAALMDLSRQVSALDLLEIVTPFLTEITRETGESSALNKRNGDNAEVVASVTGPSRLVTHMRLGDLAPLYATSGGKVILAHLPTAEREAYLDGVTFQAITPRTIRSRREIEAQIAKVRESGFAYSHEEFTPGIVGIATGVFDAEGKLLAALNIALPAVRYDDAKQISAERALKRAASGIRGRI